MNLEISDYPNVNIRAKELGLNEVEGIAFLPRHFADAEGIHDLLNESSVQTLSKLFQEKDLHGHRFYSEGHKIPFIKENALDWIVPTIFISSSLLINNPHVINIICGVIANYATEVLNIGARKSNVKLHIVVETTKTKKTKKVSYEGDIEGIEKLKTTIRDLTRE